MCTQSSQYQEWDTWDCSCFNCEVGPAKPHYIFSLRFKDPIRTLNLSADCEVHYISDTNVGAQTWVRLTSNQDATPPQSNASACANMSVVSQKLITLVL